MDYLRNFTSDGVVILGIIPHSMLESDGEMELVRRTTKSIVHTIIAATGCKMLILLVCRWNRMALAVMESLYEMDYNEEIAVELETYWLTYPYSKSLKGLKNFELCTEVTRLHSEHIGNAEDLARHAHITLRMDNGIKGCYHSVRCDGIDKVIYGRTWQIIKIVMTDYSESMPFYTDMDHYRDGSEAMLDSVEDDELVVAIAHDGIKGLHVKRMASDDDLGYISETYATTPKAISHTLESMLLAGLKQSGKKRIVLVMCSWNYSSCYMMRVLNSLENQRDIPWRGHFLKYDDVYDGKIVKRSPYREWYSKVTDVPYSFGEVYDKHGIKEQCHVLVRLSYVEDRICDHWFSLDDYQIDLEINAIPGAADIASAMDAARRSVYAKKWHKYVNGLKRDKREYDIARAYDHSPIILKDPHSIDMYREWRREWSAAGI